MHNLNLDPLLLLVLLFSHLSCFHIVVPVSAKVLMSIDCGSSSPEPYTDKNSLVWVGDNQYVQTGETRNVTTKNLPPGWDSHVMSTLREFRTRKKNCYSLDIEHIAEEDSASVERVLLRASFFYGNYDNKSTPPSFHLQINGNNWTRVVTSMDQVVHQEMVYSLNSKNSTITVCLGQTHVDHLPFISAIEVRSWGSDIYSSYTDPNYPLFFNERTAFGISTPVRFPDDSYGRIWSPDDLLGPTMVKVKSTSTSIKVNIDDNPPEIVMRTSAVNLNSSENITIYGSTDVKVPFPINLYFSEVMILNSTQKRSFNIIVNGYIFPDETFQKYGPVIPPYGRAVEVRIENVTAKYGGFKIEIVPTDDSTLPPLINAYEEFYIGDKLVQGTNSNDVISLGLLQTTFIQLQGWTGDPCLPSPFTWDWVACDSNTNSPRVIALYLNGLGLTGSLPDFSAMDALETIDFSNNSLTLEIPEFLGTLSKLNILNLGGNNFSGEIPCSLLKNNNLWLSVTGNPNLSINNNNTTICKNNTESRISSGSNNQNFITSALPVAILGNIIIQMLVM